MTNAQKLLSNWSYDERFCKDLGEAAENLKCARTDDENHVDWPMIGSHLAASNVRLIP
jgi:hypothetical protein